MSEEIKKIRNLFEEGELEEAIKEFIILTRGTSFYNIATPINISFKQYLKDKMSGFKVEGVLEKITQNFTDAFTYYIEENNFENNNLIDDKLNDDTNIELFCSFDFTHQSEYFESLVLGNSSFLCLFINGKEKEYGQEWLANKLINKFRKTGNPVHKTITIESEEASIQSFNRFIDLLCDNLNVQFKAHKEPLEKKEKLATTLTDKLRTASQFIIVRNIIPLFGAKSDFKDFIKFNEFFYSFINGNELEHKCIFLFIEEENVNTCQADEYFLFSTITDVLSARSFNNFRFISLDEIKPINEKTILEWLKKCKPEIECRIKPNIKEIVGNGNPSILIPEICKKINIDYYKFHTQWHNY